MKKTVRTGALVGALALALTACGDAPDETTTDAGGASGAPEGSSDYLTCLVSDAGGFDDQSFNQSAREGAEAARDDLGVEVQEIESQSDADYEPNIQQTVQLGCDLTVSVGFNLADATGAAAEANPDLDYALVDAATEQSYDNLKPLLFDTAQASFLAGYLAAGTTETGTIATFGGLQIPSVTVFMDGFAEGAQYYDEQNGSDTTVLGWDVDAQTGSFTGDFDNQTNGVNTAQNFIDQGADIILPVAGPVGLGAASAIQGADGVKLIWVDSDGYESTEYGDIILTSVVKEIGAAVQDAVQAGVDDEFSGDPYVGTLENGGVSLAPYHDFEDQVPAELQDQITQLQEQIVSGEVTVESPSSPSTGG
ncbi:BMP family ABC transporter substrate-binding protein [Pseudokineococcus basanitobsidens]|uniref:BMP family ABC transporter substrate-binding protein n=1 Tax=Pseudokineococcus basanitobsidens TaxID=1926649 RepID=A0ABU8RHA7_9ACTN